MGASVTLPFVRIMIRPSKYIAPHPGEILEMILSESRVTQTKLAAHLGIPQTKISEIDRKKREISAEMALKLEKALGMKATLWMSLQKNWELAQVEPSKIKKVKRLQLADSEDLAA